MTKRNTPKKPDPPQPLLTTRSALILLIAAIVAVGAGVLTLGVGQGQPESIIAGFAAGAATLALLSNLIGP